MTHMQYLPGDPRVVDQLVYELKSRGIFDQFRKECISDVDTRPAYQNLRQRVETSVATFLARQVWKPDLNKNQLREKLRKHILDGNYLEQGVERIVDQVVNPKVASVFIPQVEDLVYDFFGISRKKSTPTAETSNGKINENDLLPTDLEAVSPGSVKSNDDKCEMDIDDVKDDKMEVEQNEKPKEIIKEDDNSPMEVEKEKIEPQDTNLSAASEFTSNDSNSIDKISIPLPTEEIKFENIPPPENSPPKAPELENIELPKEPIVFTDIPLPDEILNPDKERFFKPINVNSDDDSSSDSSLRRNMSPITPIRNFNNENSCDAQQAFEDETTEKTDDNKEPSSFRFAIETKSPEKVEESKEKKVDPEQTALSYQFNNQVNINTFNTPLYDDSSNSNLLHIDYESDANSKTNNHENKVPEAENSEDSKKDKKSDYKKSSHRSSHHSRDSHRHSSSKDRRSDSKHSTSRDSSRHDRKTSSKDDHKSKSSSKDGSKDKSDKKDNRDSRESSRHRSSHKSSSSSHKDSKAHKSSSSSSSQRHSSSKHSDEKKSSSSSHREKSDKSSDKSKDSKEKSSRDSKSSSHRSDKDRKSSKDSGKSKEEKDKKKEKKDTDDHYSLSGRGNHNRRSTDRDSNDGSSSSKGSNHPSSSKPSESKKDSKSTSKSDNTSTGSESTSPSDKDVVLNGVENDNKKDIKHSKVVRVDTHLEVPISDPPRLPFVPDVTLKKPKFAENMQQAKKLMKMRKFLDEEQKRMNQEAALLLEFQANVRPSLSQVYSNISGPELEFACITNAVKMVVGENFSESESEQGNPIRNGDVHDQGESRNDALIEILTAAQQVDNNEEKSTLQLEKDLTDSDDVKQEEINNDKAKVQQPEHIEEIVVPETEKIEIQSETDEKFEFDEVKLEEYNVNEIHEIIGVPETNNTFEITEDIEEPCNEIQNESIVEEKVIPENNLDEVDDKLTSNNDDNIKKPPEYFEVTVIAEELSENEETDKRKHIHEDIRKDALQESKDENFLEYFGETEKYNAEIERDTFSKFLNAFTDKVNTSKMYLINCDTYEENLIKEVANTHGDYKIVNYYKNVHFKLSKNVVKDLNITEEVKLPVEKEFERSHLFSPVKSECSFELSSDYDAKLEEMVNKTSRQEIMEIILGSVVDESPSKMPMIDYCNESSIVNEDNSLKRKSEDVDSSANINRPVLIPNKIRKLSGSDQITSTTEENEERSNNNGPTSVRSKYLGRAKRVGLPRPKKTTVPNSPSSDKSVENYEQNTPIPNGKLKTPRKVQRYDTSDLYKPKLHYLSRRNNIS